MSESRLGRGLDQLLPQDETDEQDIEGDLRRLPIEAVQPNDSQPREEFDEQRLDELKESIESQGVLEPILVRPRDDGGFEIVAGERRWRAAQAAGNQEIPAVVRELGDEDSLALALVENLQREDLSPVEEARGYRRLLSDHEWTQQQLAESLGKSRSSVANRLRLLELSESVQKMITSGAISAGHARAIAGVDDRQEQIELAEKVKQNNWSVRQLEEALQEPRSDQGSEPEPEEGPATEEPGSGPDPHLQELRARLEDAVGTEVEIITEDRKEGHVRLYFDSPEGFDDLLDRLEA